MTLSCSLLLDAKFVHGRGSWERDLLADEYQKDKDNATAKESALGSLESRNLPLPGHLVDLWALPQATPIVDYRVGQVQR